MKTICSSQNCSVALCSADQQLVEVSSQSLSAHSLAQDEQRREVAPVSGGDLLFRTPGSPLFSAVRSQPSQAHTGRGFSQFPTGQSQQKTRLLGAANENKRLLYCTRSPTCPDPNVKSEKENLLLKRLCCPARINCWWVVFMDSRF